MTAIISYIKQLLKSDKSKKQDDHSPSTRPNIPREAIIPRSEHSISKTNISVNALKVLNRLYRSGYDAYLVGGGVRDLLLHHSPKDFDIATSARPNQVKRLFKNCRLIGRRFRLAHILFHRDVIEVATFRAGAEEENSLDQKKSDSGMIIRDNIYGDIHHDVWRRDFTINALYYSIADFSIIDFTGGFQDLKTKTLRLIGEPRTRYEEDPVRMLRAVRFCAKLDFHMAEETAAPIKAMASSLQNVSNSRLFDEVVKLYHCGNALRVHQLLSEHLLLEQLFPQVAQNSQANPITQKIIMHALESTDNRVKQQKHLTPAFLFAAMLWGPLIQRAQDIRREEKLPPLPALEKAMGQVLHQQSQRTGIPKRFTQVIREIWVLQYRLPKRFGNRAHKLTTHPRFRAAYDFLLIRALAGDESIELADWWTRFIDADVAEQEQMLIELKKSSPRPKRPRKKKPAND